MPKLEIDPRTNRLEYAHTSCNITTSGQTTVQLADGFYTSTSAMAASSTTALPCDDPTGRVQPRLHKKNSSLSLSLHRCAAKRHMQRVASILWSRVAAVNQRGIASKAPNGQDLWRSRKCRVYRITLWQCSPIVCTDNVTAPASPRDLDPYSPMEGTSHISKPASCDPGLL
jgi:hypothetical protein